MIFTGADYAPPDPVDRDAILDDAQREDEQWRDHINDIAP